MFFPGNREERVRSSSDISIKVLDQLSGYLAPNVISIRHQLYEDTLQFLNKIKKKKPLPYIHHNLVGIIPWDIVCENNFKNHTNEAFLLLTFPVHRCLHLSGKRRLAPRDAIVWWGEGGVGESTQKGHKQNQSPFSSIINYRFTHHDFPKTSWTWSHFYSYLLLGIINWVYSLVANKSDFLLASKLPL